MSDGLKAQHRAAIIAALAANDRVERAVLFGSRAMGTNTITSDVDIALFGDRLTLTDQAHLAATCDDLPMAQSVDLVLHNTIDNPALVDHIRTHGVEWYRRGGGGWKEMPFNKAFLVNPSTRLSRDVIYPYVEMSSLNPRYSSVRAVKERTFHGSGSRFMDGDTLMARITPCLENGKTARYCAKDKTVVAHGSTEFIVVRGRPGISDSSFAFYMTCSATVRNFAISQMTGTSGRQRVPAESLAHLTVRIPPLPEQRAIAHILGTLDDKIELNRRMNETLEAMAQAIFKDWFVDFGPVRAKVEGREAYLPEDVWGLFPDSFQESELGEIPRGWGVCSIGSLLTLERKSLIPGDTPQETFSHYSIPAFDNEMLPAQEMGGNIKSSKYIVSKGTFLVSKLNPKTSRVWLPSASKILKQICSTEFLVCRPSFSVGVPFSYLLAKSNSVVQRMGDLASRTSNSHQRIQLADFISLPIIRCNEKLLTFFNASISPLLQKSLETRKENSLLKKCRDILLPKLLSGEIRIQDIGFLIKGERS